jgi:hypothetical protein
MAAWQSILGAGVLALSTGLVVACTVNSTTNNSGTSGDAGSDSPASSCSQNSAVTCQQGTGWTCTSSDTPDESNPLVCSTGTVDGSSTDYCCVPDTGVTSTCSVDSTVTGCQEGTGFSCTGSDTPDQSDTSLVCSTGTADTGKTDYCCIPYTQSSTTCMQDNTVMCDAGFGFSCAGTDSPTSIDSTLNCSTPTVVDGGPTLYCCE